MVTILKLNEQYNNYAGVAPIQGTLLNDPIFNNERQTYLATMEVEAFEVRIEDEIMEVPAGNYTVGAKGPNGDKPGQYNADLHQEGKKVNFNITFTPGQSGPLFTLAPFTGVRGEMPKFGAVRKVVVDLVSATKEELEVA